MSNIQPYRQVKIVISEEKIKPLYGIIIAPKAHTCSKPGWWKRLFKSITDDSMFRCHCGRYYRWRGSPYDEWESEPEEYGKRHWQGLGGRHE